MKKPRKPKPSTTMPPPERRLVMCVIGAPHGVRGECRVKSFTGDPMAIADYGTLFSADGRVFEIDDGRFLKDDMLVVKFAGMNDRDEIAKLTGTELFVDRANLPETDEEDEFYHADLIGLEAVDAEGTVIGTIHVIQNFGAGDIIELRPAEGGATWFLPFTKAAVPKVDLLARRILIDPVFLAKPEPAKAKPADEPGD
ncbi:MAG: 16S rRNA processing protein [Beijerinckiaceae bacterium]|nr:MAG: 16S rRNA processing protein [Beijerinckiaceae bacterium]